LRETSQDFGFFWFSARHYAQWQILANFCRKFGASSAVIGSSSTSTCTYPTLYNTHDASTGAGCPAHGHDLFCVGIASLFDFLLEEESQQRQQEEDDQFIEGIARAVLSGSRRLHRSGDGNGPNKRTRIDWDHNRAKLCVQHDYWGPQPRFPDRQFERVFRITRAIANRVLLVVARADTFFTKKPDALGNPGICPKVKLHSP
jgi:hypothetical protein